MAEGVGLLRRYPLILLGLLCHTKLLIFWDNYIWERQLNPTKNCELYMIRKPKDNKISGNSIGNPCIQLQHLFGDSRKNNFRQIYEGIAREKGMHGSLLSNKYSEEESVQNVYDLGWADTRPQGMERCQPWSQETGTISTAITEDSKLYWAENICELGCHQKVVESLSQISVTRKRNVRVKLSPYLCFLHEKTWDFLGIFFDFIKLLTFLHFFGPS